MFHAPVTWLLSFAIITKMQVMTSAFSFTPNDLTMTPPSLQLENIPTQVNNVQMFISAASATTTPPTFPRALSTVALVTASDMIPFIPCQPLAMTLGSQMGVYAFPICVLGQTLAGILAFRSARLASDSKQVQTLLESLKDETREQFESFRKLGSTNIDTDAFDINDQNRSRQYQLLREEAKVLLALIGLRLAPFFPFSAGNYLLGGATGVGLRPFIIATVFGCFLSNLLSVGIGMGGAELFSLKL